MTTTHTARQLVDLRFAGVRPAVGQVWTALTAFSNTHIELRADGFLYYVDQPAQPIGDAVFADLLAAMRDGA